jgi:FMN phosphatase YigB (HAD superfamily)
MTHLTHSFDVFDTCLVRTVARPADLFYLPAQKVPGEIARRPRTPEEIIDLARLRLEAEAAARRAIARPDITLADIYAHFSHLDYWGIPAHIMMQAEIDLEIALVRPVAVIRQKIEALRGQGCRIIFISDMYLPRDIIRRMLLDHGFAHPDDPVYVSGEIGLTKHNGQLFPYVLAQENLGPGQLHHWGDNPHSDVLVPARQGLKTTFFRQSQLTRPEQALLTQPAENPWLSSQLAGVSRAVRLGFNEPAQMALVDLAAGVAGPLLTAYVAWVLHDAHRRGLKRLYFVARDGQILLKIAQTLAQTMPAPECRYLYGSRQAWFLPAVIRPNRHNLPWLMLHSTAPRHVLRKLNLAPEDIAGPLAAGGLPPALWDGQLDDAAVEKLWQVIEQPAIAALVEQNAAAARQLTLAYFRQEGLLDPQLWALVDIGWTLKTQQALGVILEKNIEGYYFALLHERLPMALSGPYHAFLLEPFQKNSGHKTIEAIFRNIQLIEQVFTMADHGSTLGYQTEQGRIVPILNNTPVDPRRAEFINILHPVVTAYTAELAQTGLLPDQLPAIKNAILPVAAAFLSTPSQAEAQAVAGRLIGDDQNESRRHRLARPLTLRDIFYYAARLLRLTQSRDFRAGYSWFEGSVVLSGWWIKLLLAPRRLFTILKDTHPRRWWHYRRAAKTAGEIL